MATRSEAAPRSRASKTRAFPRLRARAYAGSRRISSRLTFSARMNADDSRRNGYLARVASSTSEGTPRAIKGQRGDPRNGSYEFVWDLHSVSGAPVGGGATP